MPPESSTAERDPSLVSLLGEQRAAIVEHLRHEGRQPVAAIADHLGVTEVATRRHLGVLEGDGFIAGEVVNRGRGRPATVYALTDRARRLYPQRNAAVASELLQFLTEEHGRDELRRYLKWRLERQAEQWSDAVTADELPDRLEQLAEALSEAGFDATVTEDDGHFVLKQEHCAIYDVARVHPEMCAYEAASFSRVLGKDVRLTRRETLAGGASACVCSVTPTSPKNTDHDPVRNT